MSPPSLSPGPGVGRKETSSADSLRLHEKASSAIRGGPATYSPQADAASHSLASESSLVSRHAVAAAGDTGDDDGMAHKSFLTQIRKKSVNFIPQFRGFDVEF